MLHLIGYLSRGINTIHSGQAEDSISSGSLDWLQVKEKLWFRNPKCKPLHTTIHPAQAAAETKSLRELRLSSLWSVCPTRLCLCFILASSYLTPTHTVCMHSYIYPPLWIDQGDFRKNYTYTYIYICGLPLWLRQERVHLQCKRHMFSPRVGKIPWRREWPPNPVFLPGKSHGQRSLGGYSPWRCKELDTTEQLTLSFHMCAFRCD